jgi:hypothetical protein
MRDYTQTGKTVLISSSCLTYILEIVKNVWGDLQRLGIALSILK